MFNLLNKNKNNKNKKLKYNYIDTILSSSKVKQLRKTSFEKLYAIFLRKNEDDSFSIINFYEYGNGNSERILPETYKPNKIPKMNMLFKADAIVMLHNHPRYNGLYSIAYPSTSDINSTISAGELWQSKGCFLLDHIIINEDDYYSFAQNDLIII